MKCTVVAGITLMILCISAHGICAQIERTVNNVEIKPNLTSNVSGDLKDGRKIANLSFAWNSSIACFTATQAAKFTGNHVFYTVQMRPHSIVTVTVVPKVAGTDLSLYGYQLPPDTTTLPDSLGSVVTCEADYKWDRPKTGKTQTDARSMTFNAIEGTHTLMIAVVGPNGAISGAYTLKISLKQ
ncbi:hypothetical protein BH10ACI3_BH10ACI3_24460 [soil metagenome]